MNELFGGFGVDCVHKIIFLEVEEWKLAAYYSFSPNVKLCPNLTTSHFVVSSFPPNPLGTTGSWCWAEICVISSRESWGNFELATWYCRMFVHLWLQVLVGPNEWFLTMCRNICLGCCVNHWWPNGLISQLKPELKVTNECFAGKQNCKC